ncbi:MAG: UPF0175 family protein [Chloroflexi bacterium]|nr:UPF0175 family protein [Chloroflexota bacterium]
MTNILLTLPDELAQHLPADPASRQRVVELGLREWRIAQALEAYQRGEGTLAYAAERAGVTLREMIVAARARSITPKVESSSLTLEAAAQL